MDGFTYMQMLSKLEDMELTARRIARKAGVVHPDQPAAPPPLTAVTPPGEAVRLPETKSA
jgi:hypothetical protein